MEIEIFIIHCILHRYWPMSSKIWT